MRNTLIIILLLLFSKNYAQSDFDKDQQEVYTRIFTKDFTTAKNIIKTKFLDHDDLSRKVIGYVYLSDYYYNVENEAERSKALDEAKKLARKTQKKEDWAYVNFGYAKYYLTLNKNEQFVKAINQSIDTFLTLPNENFILTNAYYLQYKYIIKNNLETDLRQESYKTYEYAKKSKNPILISYTLGNLATYYTSTFRQNGDPKYKDSALATYQNRLIQINKIANPEARKRERTMYDINYASLLSTIDWNKNAETSLNIYKKILKTIESDTLYQGFKILTYNNIGSTYENVGDSKLTEEYFLKAYNLLQKKNDLITPQKVAILNNLSRWYESKNKLAEALKYEREARELVTEENKKEFENNTKNLEIYYQTEKKNQQIKNLETQNSSFLKQKILYISVIILAVAGLFFMFYNFRYRHRLNKQKTELLQWEKNEAELSIQLEKEEKARLKAEQELLAIQQEQLQKQALATQIQLSHKNTVINDIKEQVKVNNDTNIQKILRDDRLTDNDFNEIQNMIQDVHPNFFKRLSEKSKSKLTNQDLRYAAYIYLNLENQQIANILKVETKTVRMTKYRLKQKLGLDKEEDLHHFIHHLEI